MERAEFIVETKDWKTFYRMAYKGAKEQLWKFGFLVDGTVHLKLGKMSPELGDIAKKIADGSNLKEEIKNLSKIIKKEVKKAGVDPKLAEMWVAREVLSLLGLKTYPDLKEMKKILKEI